MHSISSNWATEHEDAVQSVGLATCRACHGTDYRGTVLSRAASDRSFSTKHGVKQFTRGTEVSCYACHNGADNSDPSTHVPPTVANAALAVPLNGSASLTLFSSGAGSTVQISRQPKHGAVSLNGSVATYYADAGYKGPDHFAYMATDSGGYVDSTSAGVISVTVGGPAFTAMDSDGDGLTDFVEYALGTSPDFPSVSGAGSPALEAFSGQRYLTLTVARFLPPADTNVSIEVSGDLVNWSPATILTNSSSLLKARDPISAESSSRRFIRLKVSRP
jgi:hypothetical protein